ncbi:cytochrome c [Herbaspirillum sp. YR522]|uniref:c-type cytochrome n=1 Tax=Herbaspirillum sp. YR522 TaxID=1144342 RepID=UPI00026F76D4|nr:cytochrome c [Herbaspirillum sp. YR522]EJN01235.1 cytochrome c [Herbaspirillum sp. YR522]
MVSLPEWLDWNACINILLALMQASQHALLHLLSALGLTQDIEGQPGWPFATRLSGEVLLIDRSVARSLLLALATSGLAVVLLVLGLVAVRRWRLAAWSLAAVLALAAPWPDHALLTGRATPSSFHDSPTRFSDASIVRGERLYGQQCASCHGADGRGDTTLGLSLATAPPNLAGPLLWRRADGDLLWAIRHGKGAMPAFEQLSASDAWALIDYMKANAAGTSLRETGTWQQPVRLPTLRLDCTRTALHGTDQWQGQRVRVVLARAGAMAPLEDPRMQSLLLDPKHLVAAIGHAGVPTVDCRNTDQQAWRALEIVTGTAPAQMDGLQLIADRDGWLRARKSASDDASGWSDTDMLCRSPLGTQDTNQDGSGKGTAVAAGLGQANQARVAQQGLERLIAAMDAEPVRFIKGGFVH